MPRVDWVYILPATLFLPPSSPVKLDVMDGLDMAAAQEKAPYSSSANTLDDKTRIAIVDSDQVNGVSARKLLLKCDLRLVPILGTLYLVSFFDRSNIANARLFGLEKSLNMPSNGFNTCLWIFYLPFVIIEIPSNLIMSMNKIKPNYWLAGMMFILGKSPRRVVASITYKP
jgi:hypothetical protein